MVDFSGVGPVGVDADDGLVGSLEMDADATSAEFEDFVRCISREYLFSEHGATIFLWFNTSGPVLFAFVFLPNVPFTGT